MCGADPGQDPFYYVGAPAESGYVPKALCVSYRWCGDPVAGQRWCIEDHSRNATVARVKVPVWVSLRDE